MIAIIFLGSLIHYHFSFQQMIERDLLPSHRSLLSSSGAKCFISWEYLHFYNGSQWELIKGMEKVLGCQLQKCASVPSRESHLSSHSMPLGKSYQQLGRHNMRRCLCNHFVRSGMLTRYWGAWCIFHRPSASRDPWQSWNEDFRS